MVTKALATRRIGFVGGGNMAEALVRGLLDAGVAADAVRVSEPDATRRETLGQRYGVALHGDNAELAAWADLLVVAVKPQVIEAALAPLAERVASDALVVSVVAGVPTARVEGLLGGSVRVVRAMPNTPALVAAGATAIAAGSHAETDDLVLAEALFGAVGRCVRVAEPALDAVTGLSGSGPAYVMLMVEALADGGVRAGLGRDVAQLLAAQTVYGAAKLLLDSGEHPAVLRDRVTSPGGTTSAGLAALEAAGVRGAVIAAIESATARSRELGRGG
jgi:pyrroline-5-carboxylate reductase